SELLAAAGARQELRRHGGAVVARTAAPAVDLHTGVGVGQSGGGVGHRDQGDDVAVDVVGVDVGQGDGNLAVVAGLDRLDVLGRSLGGLAAPLIGVRQGRANGRLHDLGDGGTA